VTIQAVTGGDPGLNSDTTPPILTLTPGLLDDANKLHTMPESTAVIKTGSVALDIYVLDVGSRLKSVKIGIPVTYTIYGEKFRLFEYRTGYPRKCKSHGILRL
jgi:hypothetical protein